MSTLFFKSVNIFISKLVASPSCLALASHNYLQRKPLNRKLDATTATWHGLAHTFNLKAYSMLKSELVQKLTAQNPHLYQRDLDRIVNLVLDKITDALKGGDRVELRGFGAFSTRERKARTGRNPRNGSAVDVDAKRAAAFRCGKDLRERLNSPQS